MKKIYFIITIICTLLTSCNNGDKFTLKGKIENLTTDTILVFYQAPYNSLDTIFVKNGKFEYTIPADTLTIFSLLLDDKQEIPVFANKGEKVTIEGSISDLKIEGKGDNLKMNEIFEAEKKMKNDTTAIEKWLESYSKSNPQSYTNLYLLNKYLIQSEHPNYEMIKIILDNLHGKVKDIPYISSIQKLISDRGTGVNNVIRTISIPDKNGKFPAWNALRDKITLFSFWASWDRESRELEDSLSTLKKEINNKDFQIISISLDIDKAEWLSSMSNDTVNHSHLSDFKGWEGAFIKQHKISKLPYTILIDRDMVIVDKDIYGNKLKEAIINTINKKKE